MNYLKLGVVAMFRPQATKLLACLAVSVTVATQLTGCADSGAQSQKEEAERHPTVAVGPDEGALRWFEPSSSSDLGDGSLINVKIDRISVPYTTMMVATQTVAASGIPVHLHTFEDEVIYVVNGRGAAIVGENRQEIPIETGSVLYIPIEEWHGLKNADPNQRMELLVVTTPVREAGLGDFFREVTSQPGHPPLNLPEEEFLAMFSKYGMQLPNE